MHLAKRKNKDQGCAAAQFEYGVGVRQGGTMKRFSILALLVVPFWVVTPQETAPAGFLGWTATSLASMEQALATKASGDAHHLATQPLGSFANEYFLLAHREADGEAEWHENEADVFVVESGSATLIVGGTMPNAQTTAAHEKRAAGIAGGVKHKLSQGDVVRIPARTAHQLLVEKGGKFDYFVVKVKGY
jgi:mannose-6-phosphate isomerase-like protein (cupin superfamily)